MTDPDTTMPDPVGAEPPPPPPPPPPPADSGATDTAAPAPATGGPPPEAPRSRVWLAVAALFVVVALLVGATVALFVRVQDAQETADDAIVLAGNQDAITARLDELDATLASVQTDGSATSEDLEQARDQVSALRKCVNKAIDGWAEATQSGEPTPISKC